MQPFFDLLAPESESAASTGLGLAIWRGRGRIGFELAKPPGAFKNLGQRVAGQPRIGVASSVSGDVRSGAN